MTGRRPDVLTEAAKQLRQVGRGVEPIAADVSTEKGRETTLKLALEKLGGLDILVNNAGGVMAGRLEDTTEAEIRAMIEVDPVAPILLTRAALPALRASKDGLVVNVTCACCGAILLELRGSQRWFGEIWRPAALDKRFVDLKPALAEAVRDHSAL
jgi:short-subunit dehydrogenase